MVIPGNVTVLADFLEIEPGAEEIADAVIHGFDGSIAALVVLQHIIDIAERLPGGGAPGLRGRSPGAPLDGAQRGGRSVVVGVQFGQIVGRGQDIIVYLVGPKVQFRLGGEIGVGRQCGLRGLGQEILAGRQTQCRCNEGKSYDNLFHNLQNVMSTPREKVFE